MVRLEHDISRLDEPLRACAWYLEDTKSYINDL
jgi:hypothetical protein